MVRPIGFLDSSWQGPSLSIGGMITVASRQVWGYCRLISESEIQVQHGRNWWELLSQPPLQSVVVWCCIMLYQWTCGPRQKWWNSWRGRGAAAAMSLSQNKNAVVGPLLVVVSPQCDGLNIAVFQCGKCISPYHIIILEIPWIEITSPHFLFPIGHDPITLFFNETLFDFWGQPT